MIDSDQSDSMVDVLTQVCNAWMRPLFVEFGSATEPYFLPLLGKAVQISSFPPDPHFLSQLLDLALFLGRESS